MIFILRKVTGHKFSHNRVYVTGTLQFLCQENKENSWKECAICRDQAVQRTEFLHTVGNSALPVVSCLGESISQGIGWLHCKHRQDNNEAAIYVQVHATTYLAQTIQGRLINDLYK